MAIITTILRNSSSSFALLALRLISNQKIYQSLCFTALNRASTAFISNIFALRYYSNAMESDPTRNPSSSSTPTETLLDVLDKEIFLNQEYNQLEKRNSMDIIPEDFPFEIEDIPGQKTVFLNGENDDEIIRVEVHMTNFVTGGSQGNYPSEGSTFPINVTVKKKSGNGVSLEFVCKVHENDAQILICELMIHNPEIPEDRVEYGGPSFNDLDASLQNVFQRFLEVRGVTSHTMSCMHEYMVDKDTREYIVWLKSLKQFAR